jgi:hypothetical protein
MKVATPLSKKLRLQPGQKALVLNAPEGYERLLAPLPEGVKLVEKAEGAFDFVHLFVKDSADLERLGPVAIGAVRYDGLLWLSYPKRSSKVETDLSRDTGWDLLAQAGLRPVTQVAVDEVWSALRWRPVAEVETRSG